MIHKTSNIPIFLGLFLYTFFALPVAAEGPVIRSGEHVTVEAHQVLEGDFYALGQDVVISGNAERDIYSLGTSVTVNGSVSEDLTIIGGTIQVHGKVNDDVRVIGGEVVIAEPIADDLVVIAESVRVLSTASVGGDFIFFGGQVFVDGPIHGTVYGTANNIRIDAQVGGDVSVTARGAITLGDKASIDGALTYTSPLELMRGQNAVVSGLITRNDVVSDHVPNTGKDIFLVLLVCIFSSLTIFFVLRNKTGQYVRAVLEGYGRLGLIGFGMFLALPLIALVLMASVIGFFVGFVLLLLYLVMLLGAMMTLPVLFGALFQHLIRLGDILTVFTIILGVFVVVLLLFIPYVGGLTLFIGFLVTIGYICTETYRLLKRL